MILHYTPERDDDNWIIEAVKKRPYVKLKRTFSLWSDLYITSEEKEPTEEDGLFDFEKESASFVFAQLSGDYFKIVDGILVDNFEIYFQQDIDLEPNFFVADSDVSVFSTIKEIYKEAIYVGGEHEGALPIEVFRDSLRRFPNNYERRKYVEARVSSLFRNYFENVKDAETTYQKYMDKKLTKKGSNLVKAFEDYNLFKYETILKKLQKMLSEEAEYTEKQWQEEILQIILLLYPKYVFVFREVPIHAKYNEGIHEKFLDFLLVDSNGNADIIEIKKPFENVIMTKSVYRDNYIPLRELSGTVMQIEKYIYYLNRWSSEGEKFLTNKYKDKLPLGLSIKITNPSGIIIMGRENNLSADQKQDFEVVKRKYKNVVDIITYDNLVERLSTMIFQITGLPF
jgi:hypothetical protein